MPYFNIIVITYSCLTSLLSLILVAVCHYLILLLLLLLLKTCCRYCPKNHNLFLIIFHIIDIIEHYIDEDKDLCTISIMKQILDDEKWQHIFKRK